MAKYSTPSWTNGSSPAIDATALTNMGQAIETSEHPFGTCSTAAATAAKAVTVDAPIAATGLFAGLTVCVKFSNGNSADNPTLNVNSTGAKNIMSYGANPATSWQEGQVIAFVYDGTNWMIAGFDAYTKQQTLSAATAAAIGTATGTTPDTPDEALALLAAGGGGGGNIATGSYTGTGTAGSANKNSLTFAFVPKLVIVQTGTQGLVPANGAWKNSFLWIYGQTDGYSGSTTTAIYFEQNGNTLSWWTTSNAAAQLNTNGTTYRYIALG